MCDDTLGCATNKHVISCQLERVGDLVKIAWVVDFAKNCQLDFTHIDEEEREDDEADGFATPACANAARRVIVAEIALVRHPQQQERRSVHMQTLLETRVRWTVGWGGDQTEDWATHPAPRMMMQSGSTVTITICV